MTSTAPSTPCFLSYAHTDNDGLGDVVEQFRKDLGAYYSAMTGNSLTIFMDRHSIGWGDDWRERIRASVQGATVFIPMVTMRYFDSEACCEELLAFYNNAHQLGVTGLLLPVVVLGADRISANDPREAVQLIERLQYIPITEAWVAGYDSSEWRTTMMKLVTRLEEALEAAEFALADGVVASTGDRHPADPAETADLLALHGQAEEMTPVLQEAFQDLKAFAEVAGQAFSGSLEGLSASQVNTKLLVAANKLKPVSEKFESSANDLSARVGSFDANLRATVDELNALDHDTARDLVRGMLGPSIRLTDVGDSLDQMDGLMSMLRAVSVMSSPLRNSLRPGISGIQAFRTAFSTIDSWASLAPPSSGSSD